MTTIVTRSPLNPLSMNGAHGQSNGNGNKRKSTRLIFGADDDDVNAPPNKKNKSDVVASNKTASTQPVNPGKTATTRSGNVGKTKSKKAYDEHDDDFSFSRAPRTSKRVKTQQSQSSDPPPAPQQQPIVPVDEASSETATTTRQKRKPRKTLPPSPEQDRVQTIAPRRRSKRLSAETPRSPSRHAEQLTEPAPSQNETAPVATPKKPGTEGQHEGSPQVQHAPAEQGLHVEKKRRLTKILLPTSDTPIIRRNKEMRKTSAENSRRSSSGMRGRRASSLIDSGSSHDYDLNVDVEHYGTPSTREDHEEGAKDDGLTDDGALLPQETRTDQDPAIYTAVPHSDVETEEYYKHISQDLIEPKRMRQLLVWCGNRALPQKPGGQLAPAETAAIHAARVIQEELLNEFGTKGELSSWFDREDIAPAVLVKKPNPRNVQNAEKLQQLEAELSRLQAEKQSWDDLVASSTAKAHPSAMDKRAPLNLDPATIDASLLDPSQSEILATLLSNLSTTAPPSNPNTTVSSSSTTTTPTTAAATTPSIANLTSLTSSLEFKIDRFADHTHRMSQYALVADRAADALLASGARKLETRARVLERGGVVDGGEKSIKSGGAAAASGGPVDPIDALRGLARVLYKKGSGSGSENGNGNGNGNGGSTTGR